MPLVKRHQYSVAGYGYKTKIEYKKINIIFEWHKILLRYKII